MAAACRSADVDRSGPGRRWSAPTGQLTLSCAARLEIADLRLAAWFLWMTPLLAALSSMTNAARMACVAFSASHAAAASRNWRPDVFSADSTALFRWRAFSFCLLRLIWDLIFATRVPR